jgi:Tannase and feruloyl esterase
LLHLYPKIIGTGVAMRSTWKLGLGALVVWSSLVGAFVGPASSVGETRPVRACATLATVTFADGSRVTSASETPASGSTPAHCRVTVLVPERINVIVLMPTQSWNGRYRAQGGGVYEGVLIPPTGGLELGYATSATDTGHQSALLTAEWAWSPTGPNYAQIQDFGYRANHEMAVKSKALIEAYYGRAPEYAYWSGCSSGGRGGLTEAMRYPDDFDGVLAGAPAINWTRFIPAEFWPQMVMMQRGNRLPACKLQAFTNAAIEACDEDDGARDGMFYAPTCRFDPKSLIGQDTGCGTIAALDAQVVQAIWDGPRGPDGRFLWYGLDRGTDLGSLAGSIAGPDGQPVDGNPFLVSTEWLKWFIHKDPTWDWRLETYDQFVADFDQSVSEWSYALGTNDPDLSRFKSRGGKVLIWHGTADPLIFSAGTIDYYKRVVGRMGGLAATQRFVRLFMAPNVGHCGGGAPAPTDPFQAVVDWVEEGKAPDTLPAHLAPATGVNRTNVTMTRHLCLWPKVSVYKGSGPITEAASFRCVSSGKGS